MRIALIASLLLGLSIATYSGLAQAAKPGRAVSYVGRVVTADGKPVAGAEVTLTSRTDDWDRTVVVARTRTRADGAFTFPDQKVVPDRPAQVLVQADGLAMATTRAAADGDIEVVLEPATSLRVTFVAPDGKPAAGVELGLTSVARRSAEFDVSDPLPPELGRALAGRTDGDGVIVLRHLPQRASVRLATSDPRFAHLSYEDNVETRDGPVSPPATVRLRAGGYVAGTVTHGESGKPAAGVEVTAQSLNVPRAAHDGWGRAVTDARGVYRMEQVGEGDYNVMLGTNSDTFRRDWTAAALPGVHLNAGENLARQDLRLIKGVVVSGKVVRGDSGKGVADTYVGLHGPDHPATSSMIASVRTDAEGSYTMRTVPGPNHLYLAAQPPDGYRTAEARDVNVVDGQPLTIDFNLARKPGTPVAGRVVDPDGKPVAGAAVWAEAKDGDFFGHAQQISDERGDFYFEAITPGTMIRGASRGLETPEAVIVNGGEPEVVVRLAKRVRVMLSGAVTDADGHPITNAKVEVIRHEGKFGMGMGRPELTDRQGRYRIQGLMPSMRYTVQAESPGLGSVAAKVELDASKETAEAPALKFQAVSKAIAGVVVDGAGKPAAGLSVEIEGEETGRQTAVTDAQGRFEFRGVAGARVKIKVGGDAPAWDARAGDGDIRLTIKSRGGDDAGRRGG